MRDHERKKRVRQSPRKRNAFKMPLEMLYQCIPMLLFSNGSMKKLRESLLSMCKGGLGGYIHSLTMVDAMGGVA